MENRINDLCAFLDASHSVYHAQARLREQLEAAGLLRVQAGGGKVQYRPTHMVLTGDGQLVLTYGDTPGPSQMGDGGVWKYDTRKGKWTDISPVRLSDGRIWLCSRICRFS